MIIIVGNGHGDQSSELEQGCLHSTNTLENVMQPTILHPAMGK